MWMDESDENFNVETKFSEEEKSSKETHDGPGNHTKDGILRKRSNGDIRTVSIQIPPKRRRLESNLSVKQLVHGE